MHGKFPAMDCSKHCRAEKIGVLVSLLRNVVLNDEIQRRPSYRAFIFSYQTSELKKNAWYVFLKGERVYHYEYIVSLADVVTQYAILHNTMGLRLSLVLAKAYEHLDQKSSYRLAFASPEWLSLHNVLSLLGDIIALKIACGDLGHTPFQRVISPLENERKEKLINAFESCLAYIVRSFEEERDEVLRDLRIYCLKSLDKEVAWLSEKVNIPRPLTKALRKALSDGDALEFLVALGCLRVLEKSLFFLKLQ